MNSQFPHRCSCGANYTRAQWQSLKYVGIQHGVAGEQLELRNCSCGTTRAIVLVAAADENLHEPC